MNETDAAPVIKESTSRRPWEPLGFEKIAAADAETAATQTTNVDGIGTYS